MSPEKKVVLAESLGEWYRADATRQKMLSDIVSGRAGVSLRLMDWFVTNYTVRKPVIYEHQGKLVSVNSDYKDVLRCFHKTGFDSFRRRGGDDSEEAALRQHNFFKWAIANGVVDYVMRHSREIERDMAMVKQRKHSIPPSDEKHQTKRKKQKPTPAVMICEKIQEVQMPESTALNW